MTYYNTVGETEQLDLFTRINKGQDRLILAIIKWRDKVFSAKDIFNFCKNQRVQKAPLMTSIRRSINTLKRAGYIRPTGERVPGLYGRSELQYKLV